MAMKYSVSPKELAVLEVLWAEENIDYHRILDLSEYYRNPINPQMIHRLLRSLQDKKLIEVSGEEKVASTIIKRYRPAITIDEYICAVLDENPILEEKHLPGVIVFLYRKIRSRETRAELLAIIQNEKERLQ